MKRSRWIALAGAALAVALATAGTAAGASKTPHSGGYTVTPLVSDQAGVAPNVDPNLVNGWGISAGPATPWWVVQPGHRHLDPLRRRGHALPAAAEDRSSCKVPGGPTGTVFNGERPRSWSRPPRGRVASRVPLRHALRHDPRLGRGPAATVGFDGSKWGAVYTGLAISGTWLYATDFRNGRVDIIDGDWKHVKTPGAFTDPRLPKGYSPFGIQAAGGSIFVAYAKPDPKTGFEIKQRGLGIVDQYSPDGVFRHRVATRGMLNAPWGIAWAPATGFGKASGTLLVGNFGDGYINTYRPDHKGRWKWNGRLLTKDRKPVWIDGLWGIGFGNGACGRARRTRSTSRPVPSDATHGLYGTVTANIP